MTYTCHRCTMTFHVVDKYPDHGEVSRCGEPVCRMEMHTTLSTHVPVKMRVLASVAEERAA